MPPLSNVNKSAITPATSAITAVPATNQAMKAAAPPVASAPGNRPSTERSTPAHHERKQKKDWNVLTTDRRIGGGVSFKFRQWFAVGYADDPAVMPP